MPISTSDNFLLTDEGRPLDHYIWTPLFNHMLNHSDWHDLQITTHSLCIGGATVCHHSGEEKMEICQLGHWSNYTIF